MIKSIQDLWSKKKIQYFVYTHLLLLIGVLTVPVNVWYAYDILIFILVTWPIFSLTVHVDANHNYIEVKNKAIKIALILYMIANNFWKFSDAKSYHIAHHKHWLTDNDPTANEVRQGFMLYYLGLTNPTPIATVNSTEDPLINLANRYFYQIKILLTVVLLLFLGWDMFVHLVVVQIFLLFFFNKAIEIIYHHADSTKDHPWLFVIFGNDAWHISHHADYAEQKWFWKPLNIQYLYYKILFNPRVNTVV